MKINHDLIYGIQTGDFMSLARALTIVENDLLGSDHLLCSLVVRDENKVIGITGPPGAGKSTLVSALINELIIGDHKVAVLAVDPTSPFNMGSLLGDRIRMSPHFNNPSVYIRSVATRGSVGGLSAKIIEMTDVLRAGVFDYIIIETVGVGQSEIEIAGLADKTIVVLVPEAGDEIQHIKSGLMEIADVFVVNKADREGGDSFANGLIKMLHGRQGQIPVLKTIAHKSQGINEVIAWINSNHEFNNRKSFLYTEKAFKLIQNKRMIDISRKDLFEKVELESHQSNFNIYRFIDSYLSSLK
ncbi:methylmalonyl Co-A mutase-associated GTPase MeaB [Pedobacter sp. JCM 36344]|uniref:methylmalonyl Co-A mutase-associated GTPase MeaB n=1 Tax=Pedobacter sp. JCM 36344 TaxID=3374280 RepID=UPI0039780004